MVRSIQPVRAEILFKERKDNLLQTNADFGSYVLPLFSGNIALQRRVIHTQYYFLLSSKTGKQGLVSQEHFFLLQKNLL